MYTTKTTDIERKPYGNHLLVEIFKDKEKIGEYVRNYSVFNETFYPFKQNGKDYALYSKDYTATRVMSLPDCKDLGGEERDTYGFCPVEYYIPDLTTHQFASGEVDPYPYNPRHHPKDWALKVDGEYKYKENGTHEYKEGFKEACQKFDEEVKLWDIRHPIETHPATWGFVYGCYWAYPYQIMFLDLSQVSEGIIKRDERFGYIDILDNIKLKDAIDARNFDFDNQTIQMAVTTVFKLTGERCE